ncbi:hypothetical protein ACVWZV_005220 [Bradyrhizobium sp. GM5.1]
MPTAFRVAMALCISTLFVGMGANAQSLPREVATRAEIYPIPSLTLSDQQFLSGDAAAGKPVTVAGELRVAQGSGNLPSWC